MQTSIESTAPRRSTLRSKLVYGGVCATLATTVLASTLYTASADTRPGAPARGDVSGQYRFKPLATGGGGFVTSVIPHPTVQGLIYARTDVGGAYRFDAGTKTWTQMLRASALRGESPPAEGNDYDRASIEGRDNDYSTEALAVSATDTNVVYLAVGGIANETTGRILKSTDRGATWTAVGNRRWEMRGNDISPKGARAGVNRLSVDPKNANIVYFASRKEGLWRSTDAGNNWQQIPSGRLPFATNQNDDQNGILGVRFAIFDPTSGVDAQGRTKRIYAHSTSIGLYRSDDAGETWTMIRAIKPRISEALIDPNGVLYVAAGRDFEIRVEKDQNGQDVWRDVTTERSYVLKYDPARPNAGVNGFVDITPPPVYPGTIYSEYVIGVDPSNPNLIVAGADGLSYSRTWVTTSGGEGATPWRTLSPEFGALDVPWHGTTGEEGYFTTGQIVFDPFDAGKLWIAQGIGVWTTKDFFDDGQMRVDGVSSGIEELVTSDIIAPPGGKTVSASMDFHGFYHENVDVFPTKMIIGRDVGAVTGLDYSGGNPLFVAIASGNTNSCGFTFGCASDAGYSRNGGKDFTNFVPKIRDANGTLVDAGAALSGGNIAVSASGQDPVIIWAPTGWANDGRVVRRSTNLGATWETVNFPVPVLRTHRQISDAARRSLESDKVTGGTFYLVADIGYQNNLPGWRVMRSTDGGQNWALTSAQLPLSSISGDFDVHSQIRAVPGFAGNFWVSTGTGLLYSEDRGDTFKNASSSAFQIQRAFAFGFGKAYPGRNYPAVYAHARINGQWGIWRSIDKAATWDLVSKYPGDLYMAVGAVSGDMNIIGRVYVGFGGHGFVYGDDTNINAVPTPAPTTQPTALPTTSPATPSPTPVSPPGSGADIVIYDDVLASNWRDGGWSVVTNLNNTTPVKTGTKSAAVIVSGAWGGFTLDAVAPVSLAGVKSLDFWVHGPAKLQVHLFSDPGTIAGTVQLPDQPAGWNKISLDLTRFNGPAQVSSVRIQDRSGGAQPPYYLDDIRFVKPAAPAAAASIFGDAFDSNWQNGSWLPNVANFANTTPVKAGNRSIAVNFTNAWDAVVFGAKTPVPTAGKRALTFWIYGAAQVQVHAFDASNTRTGTVQTSGQAGTWTLISIDLSALGNPAALGAIYVQDRSGGAQPVFYLDEVSLQ